MQNLSQKKRQRMFDFLEKIKSMHREDEKALIAIGEIENELIEKIRIGLGKICRKG